MTQHEPSLDPWTLAANISIQAEDPHQLVSDGIVAMQLGDEIDQEDLFALWRAKYG